MATSGTLLKKAFSSVVANQRFMGDSHEKGKNAKPIGAKKALACKKSRKCYTILQENVTDLRLGVFQNLANCCHILMISYTLATSTP
jgi:hypothetical protein